MSLFLQNSQHTLFVLFALLLPAGWACGSDDVAPPAEKSGKVRVALYCDEGSLKGAASIEKCLAAEPEQFQWNHVTAKEIRQDVLQGYDVVVLGGGSGSKIAKTLEVAGREKLRKFVEDGGGYLGICAGAYLASADYDWSLHIVNARVVDRQHWNRGGGQVKLALTPDGRKLLDIQAHTIECRYHQGPLLAPAKEAGLPAYTALTLFASEITKKGIPKGQMIGTTAMACAPLGKGRVFLSSPHPEATAGLHSIIQTAVHWLAKQEQ